MSLPQLNKIHNGLCLEILKQFPDEFFDSCVTDPPYGISFMNKHWDYDVPKVEVWKEILRVLKPGAHLLCACGTRTQHRMAVNIEDAGFEIRDVITWHYGSGFPKSLDVSKAIDKQAGVEREVVSENYRGANAGKKSGIMGETVERTDRVTSPSTIEAKQWEGWGTALKPATEFWTLARKPLSENTVADNVLKYGTGGINIDGSRIKTSEELSFGSRELGDGVKYNKCTPTTEGIQNSNGRFPANVILDEFMAAELDKQTGILISGHMDTVSQGKNYGIYGKYNGKEVYAEGDSGGASRFFYCPKADNYERNKGLNGFELKEAGIKNDSGPGFSEGDPYAKIMRRNNHPTVKPIDLMKYLVKLITPKHGVCLDPYCGSGTTLIGCKMELVNYVGIDMVEEYCKIAEARVSAWNPPKYIEQTLF